MIVCKTKKLERSFETFFSIVRSFVRNFFMKKIRTNEQLKKQNVSNEKTNKIIKNKFRTNDRAFGGSYAPISFIRDHRFSIVYLWEK